MFDVSFLSTCNKRALLNVKLNLVLRVSEEKKTRAIFSTFLFTGLKCKTKLQMTSAMSKKCNENNIWPKFLSTSSNQNELVLRKILRIKLEREYERFANVNTKFERKKKENKTDFAQTKKHKVKIICVYCVRMHIIHFLMAFFDGSKFYLKKKKITYFRRVLMALITFFYSISLDLKFTKHKSVHWLDWFAIVHGTYLLLKNFFCFVNIVIHGNVLTQGWIYYTNLHELSHLRCVHWFAHLLRRWRCWWRNTKNMGNTFVLIICCPIRNIRIPTENSFSQIMYQRFEALQIQTWPAIGYCKFAPTCMQISNWKLCFVMRRALQTQRSDYC